MIIIILSERVPGCCHAGPHTTVPCSASLSEKSLTWDHLAQSARMFVMRKCSPGKLSPSDQLQKAPIGGAEASVLDMLWVRSTCPFLGLSPQLASSLQEKQQPELLELLLRCSKLCKIYEYHFCFLPKCPHEAGFLNNNSNENYELENVDSSCQI